MYFMAYLVCDKCGGYYELQPDESPENFTDKCNCGGNLKYIKDLNDLEGLQNLYPSTNKFEEFLKKEENQYLIEWAKPFLVIVILCLFFGILFGRSIMVLAGLGLLIGMSYTFLFENKFSSKLEKILNIKLKNDNGFSMGSYTYEGLSWNLLICVSILFIVLLYPIVIVYNNFPAYIGLLFILIYPLVIMIIRNRTFSDNSIPSEENPIGDGDNLVVEGPGYNPLYYWLFSFSIGCVSTIWGFSMLNFSDIPVNQGIFLVLVGLVLQTLVLFPDVINWVSPVDIRTKKGVQLMSGVTVTIVILLIFLRAI